MRELFPEPLGPKTSVTKEEFNFYSDYLKLNLIPY